MAGSHLYVNIPVSYVIFSTRVAKNLVFCDPERVSFKLIQTTKFNIGSI